MARTTKSALQKVADSIHPSFKLDLSTRAPSSGYQTLSFQRNGGDVLASISGLIAPASTPRTRFDVSLRAKGLTADQIKRVTKILAE